jgi:large subunit ribosomal protein L18
MSLLRNLALNRKRRTLRNRKRILSKSLSGERIRISVCRTLKHFYAQAIDDSKSITILGMSSNKINNVVGKKNVSKEMGLVFSKILSEKGISKIVFDRGSYLYHGRIAEFANGLREGGLSF